MNLIKNTTYLKKIQELGELVFNEPIIHLDIVYDLQWNNNVLL